MVKETSQGLRSKQARWRMALARMRPCQAQACGARPKFIEYETRGSAPAAIQSRAFGY